eukprot:scaffold564_cov248-Pinguiococcus_pyrenoidosus.AAC.20
MTLLCKTVRRSFIGQRILDRINDDVNPRRICALYNRTLQRNQICVLTWAAWEIPLERSAFRANEGTPRLPTQRCPSRRGCRSRQDRGITAGSEWDRKPQTPKNPRPKPRRYYRKDVFIHRVNLGCFSRCCLTLFEIYRL